MIRVQVDLVPFGVLAPEAIGTIEIANAGSGSQSAATYRYRLITIHELTGRVTRRAWRDLPGTHRRSDGVWVLLAHVAEDIKRRRIGRRRQW